jgi:hypothetical protein
LGRAKFREEPPQEESERAQPHDRRKKTRKEAPIKKIEESENVTKNLLRRFLLG